MKSCYCAPNDLRFRAKKPPAIPAQLFSASETRLFRSADYRYDKTSAMRDAMCRPGNEAPKIVKLVIFITDTLSLNVVSIPCWGFEGLAKEIPTPPSDHIPLRRRWAFEVHTENEGAGGFFVKRTLP
jgi:hypothetical protein